MITKLKQYKKWLLIFSIPFLFFMSFLFKENPNQEVVEEPLLEQKEEVPASNIKIDIKGAIQNPGVYELDSEDRVEDAIKKSGGFLENADTKTINLSKKLEDEMVIIIYTKEEINAFLEEDQRQNKLDTTCICPKIENQACIKEATTNYQEKEETTSKTISLNQATIEDFQTLSGIGEAKARAIVQYRETNGPFNSIEEIKNVSGIGEATFEKIKDSLTL